MTQNTSYHLWLKPSGAIYDALARTIEELSRRLGGPTFVPHVTLLGSLSGTETEHCKRIEALAEQLQPFDVVLAEPAVGPKYFECIFMRVQPTAPVMNANELSRRVFDRADETYHPHLSIVYGDFAESEKQGVIPGLSAFAHQSFPVDRVVLIKASSREPRDWYEIANAVMSASAKEP